MPRDVVVQRYAGRPEDVGMREGARLTRVLVRRIIERLITTGRFATLDVSAREENGRVVLVIDGRCPIRPRIAAGLKSGALPSAARGLVRLSSL